MQEINDLITGLKKGFKSFGDLITILINSILLSIVYIIGVGITSIIAKIVGKHFMDTKLKKNGTYWTNLDLKKKPIEDYYRQF